MSSRHLRRLRVEHLEDRAVPATFTVTSTAASGAGSFAQAILDANGSAGPDRIEFNIALGGVQTIVGAPPEVTDAVTIDGTTQPGFAGTPIVVLNLNAQVLELRNHTGSTVRGLVLQNGGRFSLPYSFDTDYEHAGLRINGGGGHTIVGCYIGTDVTGTESRGNNWAGVSVNDSSNNRIGGPTPADRNLISGNGSVGVLIFASHASATNNIIQGNYFNTDASGSHALTLTANYQSYDQLQGIQVDAIGGSTATAIVGGLAPGEGNRFANAAIGVGAINSHVRAQVLGNSFTKILRPIVNSLDGFDAAYLNDPLDIDTGPSNFQNYPVVTTVTRISGGGATIAGALASTPNRTFRIELFQNGGIVSAPRSGLGQAGEFLGGVNVTTNVAGNALFNFSTTTALADGDNITATATDLIENVTSYASAPHRVQSPTWYAVAPDAGRIPEVKVYNQDGSLRFSLMAYEASFRGGVHVATGDVNADGVLDLITGAGGGGGPLVKVFDGRNGSLLRAFFAYDPAFRGGVNVASAQLDTPAGDDIVTGAGVGGGPHVKFFSGATGIEFQSFMAYDLAFRGGVIVAAAPTGAPFGSLVATAPGPGGGPHVKIFVVLSPIQIELQKQFLAGPQSDRSGLNIAFAEFTGDAYPDLVIAPGPGRAPEVQLYDLRASLNGPTAPLLVRTIVAYDLAFTGGVRVTGADLNYDGISDIITAPGKGGGPHVRAFDGATGANILNFFPFDPSFTGGLFVG
jgi:hypothetical protein